MPALLFARFTWRHWRRGWKQTLLLVLTLAVGLSVFVSVRLANRAAVEGFERFTDRLSAQSDGTVRAPSGQLWEDVLPQLKAALDGRAVHLVPVAETTGAFVEDNGAARTVRLLGLDVVALGNLPGVEEGALRGEGSAFWQNLRDPQKAYPSAALTRERGLAEGDIFALIVQDRLVELSVGSILPEPEGATPRDLVVMDLPHVQALAGRPQRLDRVEILVAEGPGEDERAAEARAALQAAAGGQWTVQAPEARGETTAGMTQAFRYNLFVLSLISIVVGVYLVLQALEAAVVRRRGEIAVLRSLGVEAGDIRRAWLLEALVLGTLGSVLGIALGWAGATVAVEAVGQTMNLLYAATRPQPPVLTGADIGQALALGLAASLLAGWVPAREAARTPPAQVLVRGHRDRGLRVLRHPGWGVPLLVLAGVLAFFPPVRLEGGLFPVAGFAAAIAALLGMSLLSAAFLRGLARMAIRLRKGGAVWTVALSRLKRPSGRHTLSAAGLVIATGMAGAIVLMVHSFEGTMQAWVKSYLVGDLYVSSGGTVSASSENRVREATWRELADDPAVARSEVTLMERIRLDGRQTMLMGADLEGGIGERIWIGQPPEGVRLMHGSTVIEPALASESFAWRFGVESGDVLEVPTPYGPRKVAIAGIFGEYGNEQGSLLVPRAAFADWFGHRDALRVAFELREGSDAEEVRARWLEKHPALDIRTNAALREEVLRIFRQTFSVTYALQGIGIVVAVAGLALGLISLAYETRGEAATLRALGMGRRELGAVSALEGAGVAAGAMLGGLALSLGLGTLLVFVINKQSFGWTLVFGVPSLQLLAFAVVVITAGGVVGWTVGRWGRNLPSGQGAA